MISLRNNFKNTFSLGLRLWKQPSVPVMSFASKQKGANEVKTETPMKLVFADGNKTTVFKHSNGEVYFISRISEKGIG